MGGDGIDESEVPYIPEEEPRLISFEMPKQATQATVPSQHLVCALVHEHIHIELLQADPWK